MDTDITPQYQFKFRGHSVWLLLDSPDLQSIIDSTARASPPWPAHCTVLYGVHCDEAEAKAYFAKLANAVEHTALALEPVAPLKMDNFAPFEMRVAGIPWQKTERICQLHCAAADAFETATEHTYYPHTSLVYECFDSTRVDEGMLAALTDRWPQVLTNHHRVKSIALVRTEGTIGEWQVLDEIPVL